MDTTDTDIGCASMAIIWAHFNVRVMDANPGSPMV